MVDPKLLGRLLEGVVHGELSHFLFELVETFLAALLVESDDGEVVLVTVSCLLVWRLVMLVITFSWSLRCCLANLSGNISS